MKHHYQQLIKIIGFLCALCVSHLSFADASSYDNQVAKELYVSQQCCASSSISYCDISAGHYVCKNGTYSACICTQQTSVSAKPLSPIGCCTWHGGVMEGKFGQVVCRDGSLSEVCGDQSLLNRLNL